MSLETKLIFERIVWNPFFVIIEFETMKFERTNRTSFGATNVQFIIYFVELK